MLPNVLLQLGKIEDMLLLLIFLDQKIRKEVTFTRSSIGFAITLKQTTVQFYLQFTNSFINRAAI